MISIVLAGYATLMLTIVLALFTAAARRPESSAQANASVAAEELPVRRAQKPSRPTPPRTKVHGGTEVLAFGA